MATSQDMNGSSGADTSQNMNGLEGVGPLQNINGSAGVGPSQNMNGSAGADTSQNMNGPAGADTSQNMNGSPGADTSQNMNGSEHMNTSSDAGDTHKDYINFEKARDPTQICLSVLPDHLKKYMKKIIDLNLQYDTFINLSHEDLIQLGILDEEERTQFLKVLGNLHIEMPKFKDKPKLDIPKVIKNTNFAILMIHGDLIKIQRYLYKNVKNKLNDPLLIPGVTASAAGRQFLRTLSDGLYLFEHRCDEAMNILARGEKKVAWYADGLLFYTGASLAVSAIVAFLVYRNHQY